MSTARRSSSAPTAAVRRKREAIVREHMESENRLDFDATMGTFHHPRYELIATGDVHDGEGEVARYFEESRAAFPDMQIRVLHMAVDGDVAIAYAMFEGTQEGEFMSMPPSGKRVSVPMADVVRFDADGRAVEHWGVTDTGAMMMQLGAVPAPAG